MHAQFFVVLGVTIPSASTLFGGDCNTLIQPTSADLRKIRIDIVKDTATNKPTAFANQYCTILSYVNTQICTDYWQVSNPNETYIRHLNPAYNTWSSWQRIDNFGCNTPADLASLLGAQANDLQSVYSSTKLTVMKLYGETNANDFPLGIGIASGSSGFPELYGVCITAPITTTGNLMQIFFGWSAVGDFYVRRKINGYWDSSWTKKINV